MKTLHYFTKRDETGWEIGHGSKVKIKNGKAGRTDINGTLKMDKEKIGDGKLWIMQRATVLKAQYSKEDEIEKQEYAAAPYVTDGEIVEIKVINADNPDEYETKQYKVHINGNYSDAGYFEEVKQ